MNIPGSAGLSIQQNNVPAAPPHASEREKEMIWRMTALQQKQQIELAQAQNAAHHVPPGIHFHPPPSVPHTHPPGTTSTAQQQPLIFQFPNMEELARAQRHQLQEGLAIMPTPQFQQLVATTPGGILPVETRVPHDEQANIKYATLHPGISLELLQQQQQQALLQQQQHQHQHQVIGHLSENLELQQQVEAIVQQSQKDPTIMFHPQARAILAQYQAAQDMYAQQHHMQELMMHQLQQQQQQEVLKQQHKQQQQQQQQQQSKYHQGSAMRPGVIISHSK